MGARKMKGTRSVEPRGCFVLYGDGQGDGQVVFQHRAAAGVSVCE